MYLVSPAWLSQKLADFTGWRDGEVFVTARNKLDALERLHSLPLLRSKTRSEELRILAKEQKSASDEMLAEQGLFDELGTILVVTGQSGSPGGMVTRVDEKGYRILGWLQQRVVFEPITEAQRDFWHQAVGQ